MNSSTINPKDFVTSLSRGLNIIRAFDATDREMTLSEVAAKTGMTRAGARRFLLTLLELGYVRQSGRQFSLTPKILALGYAYMASTQFGEIAQPFLDQVTRETGESSSMAVLDGADVAYVTRSRANRLLMIGIHVGARLPAVTTSMGRVLLAEKSPQELDQFLGGIKVEKLTKRTLTDRHALKTEIEYARRHGYYILDQELETGVRSMAVPVLSGQTGKVVSAINIATNVATVSKRQLLDEFLPVLRHAADEITRAYV